MKYTVLQPITLELVDQEWEKTKITHDRHTARAIVVDQQGYFYFVRCQRNDIFGTATTIETSGGGVEPQEQIEGTVLRELEEELGLQCRILCPIGLVSDYYNVIQRHNLNHYFLCEVKAKTNRHLTQAEQEEFHLTTMRLSAQEVIQEYHRCMVSPLGRLIAQRELPIFDRALEILGRK